MTLDTILQAMTEAERFMRAAKVVKSQIDADPTCLISGTKKTGTLRRASLDLTRALAELRKP